MNPVLYPASRPAGAPPLINPPVAIDVATAVAGSASTDVSIAASIAAPVAAPAAALTDAPPDAPASVPALVAALYGEAPASLRERLLNHLLRAVGPLALAAVAAGAFARLLPAERWGSVQVHLDDVFFRIRPDHVADLASYVEQKAPEMLWGLPDVLSSSPLLMGTLTGALLLVALRQALRQGRRAR